VPELPEVETVRRGLAPVLAGARLKRVVANRSDLRFPLPENFTARLRGARIKALRRRAKYLLAELDTGETLAMHLGMSGRFTIVRAKNAKGAAQPGAMYYSSPPNPAHTHIVFETEAGARVEYNDPRRFGYMTLVNSDALSHHALFAGLGPEPLEAEFSPASLAASLSGKKQNVKATLLDQRVVAGLGNIYVCEALHRAKISPRRGAGRVTKAECATLVSTVRAVLEEAIEAGGSSLKDYANTEGALGYFQHRFRVYDRAGLACLRRGCDGAIRRIVQAGRSTFYCPVCQR
jgi:formamidopyrimidine-DNA glycosylase